MLRYFKISIIVLISLVLTNCATIFKGSSAEVRFDSTPPNAEILIDGFQRGTTPTALNLQRDQGYTVTFKKDGYEDVRVRINKKFDAATTIAGNLVSWWGLGVIVDLISGAAYTLTPADIQGNLDKLENAGIIDRSELEKNSVHVFMLTKKQWEEIKNAE